MVTAGDEKRIGQALTDAAAGNVLLTWGDDTVFAMIEGKVMEF